MTKKVSGASFWRWYERHYTVNLVVVTSLFLLQVVHLLWLTFDVVLERLTGVKVLNIEGLPRLLIVLVDHLEIPALLSGSALYLHSLRRQFRLRDFLLLLAINAQWLHILWITDAFIVGEFRGGTGARVPAFLAWVAIAIDYLELPVLLDASRKLLRSLRARTSPVTSRLNSG